MESFFTYSNHLALIWNRKSTLQTQILLPLQLLIQRKGERNHRRLQQIVKYFAAEEIALVGDAGYQQKRNEHHHRHQQRVEQGKFKPRRQPAGEEKDHKG